MTDSRESVYNNIPKREAWQAIDLRGGGEGDPAASRHYRRTPSFTVRFVEIMAKKDQLKQEPRPEPKPNSGKTGKNGGHTIPVQMC